MNVAFDRWIPVVKATGERQLASLCSVLTEGGIYSDLAVRPHERVALMRLFLCVAHAALDGPKNYDEWCDVPKRLPDAAGAYLSEWKDSFELFHPTKPWLQVKDLCGDKTSPVALLDFELATGNNSTIYDHSGQMVCRELPSDRIALILLAFLNFSPGGGAPIAVWEPVKTAQVGNPDAPCLSQSMAHCMFRGRDLAETVHLNLPSLEKVSQLYRGFAFHKKDSSSNKGDRLELQDIAIGRPIWEFFPDKPHNLSDPAINATSTYLGRLVPVSRWIRLLGKSEMYCCCGFKYNTFKDGFPAEPTAVVQVVTKRDAKGNEVAERKLLKVQPAKSIWRELAALIVKRTAFGVGGPLAIENVPYDSEFDFHVCAMTRDQASMDIAIESVFHITPRFQTNIAVYQSEVKWSEWLSSKLGWAIETYRKEIDGDWQSRLERSKEKWALKERLYSTATTYYWTTVEKNLSLLMSHIEAIGTDAVDSTREVWRAMLFRSASEAYSVACGQETSRQRRAFAKGWQRLFASKGEPETDSTEIKEDDE